MVWFPIEKNKNQSFGATTRRSGRAVRVAAAPGVRWRKIWGMVIARQQGMLLKVPEDVGGFCYYNLSK